jgi:hypothetical protein
VGSLYPYVEAAVMAACLGLILFPVAALGRQRGIGPAMLWAAAGVGWFLLVWELARSGAFEGTRVSGRLVEMAVILVPLAVGFYLLRPGAPVPIPPTDLVTVQAIRIVAVVVLLAFAGEALPAWLALPIGIGDTVLGLTAPWVAGRVRAGASGLGALRLWNVIGATIAVFTMVAPVSVAHSTGYFFSLYPLVLFPTFLAPSALLGHLATFHASRVREASNARR